jgi:hypothetical protein
MLLNVSVATQTEASLPAGQAGNRDAAHQSGKGVQRMTCRQNEAILPLWFSVLSVAKKQNEPILLWALSSGLWTVLSKRTQFSAFLSEFRGLFISQFYILHSQFRRFTATAAFLTLPTGSLTLCRPDLDRKGKV